MKAKLFDKNKIETVPANTLVPGDFAEVISSSQFVADSFVGGIIFMDYSRRIISLTEGEGNYYNDSDKITFLQVRKLKKGELIQIQ